LFPILNSGIDDGLRGQNSVEFFFLFHYILHVMSGESQQTGGVPMVNKTFVNANTVEIRLSDTADPNSAVDELNKLFDNLFKDGIVRIVFDMGNVPFPGGGFIAMLIARTMEARRSNGDVCLMNVPSSAKNHFSVFTPLTYLSINKPFPDEPVEDAFDGVAESNTLEDGIPRTIHAVASVYSLNRLTDFVTNLAQGAGLEPLEVSKLKIAVYEACMNVIEHGYRFEPGHLIGVEVLKEKGMLSVTVTDKGQAFDFYGKKDYDVKDAFSEGKTGGYGLFIIRRSVEDVQYESHPKKGNRLTLLKKIKLEV
jgi:serine/threonine-protein kinase RsbW